MCGGRLRIALVAALALVALTGCELKDDGDNLVNGKELFAQECGSCHQLARAGAQGAIGPSLDQAFERAVKDGFGRSTYKGVVVRQIAQPNGKAIDPYTGEEQAMMPADIVKGEDAEDVAAYVAYAAARGGEDSGQLAQAGLEKSEEVAQAEGGTLDIPAEPSGATLYTFGSAEAPPGALTITSVNESDVPHNIALEGGGVDEVGEVVTGGDTSTVEVEVEAGEYTFYCSVQGHRENGMEGKLTVE